MSLLKYLKQILLLFSLILISKNNFSQNLFDIKNSLEYANYLQTSGQYQLATEEFERVLFFYPKTDSLITKLFYNKRKSGDALGVINFTNKTYYNSDSINTSVFIEYIKSLIQIKPQEALNVINKNTKLDTEQRIILQSYSYTSMYMWNEAIGKLNQLNNQSTSVLKSKVVLNDALKYKYKKPILAAGLSLVIPGLGKVYTGNIKDGIIALVFVGINSFQSYRYFEKKGIKSVGGWIFGSLGTGFYLGNIYGSYKAAIIKNKKIKDAYKKQIEEITDMD